jgi:hypothetical protein
MNVWLEQEKPRSLKRQQRLQQAQWVEHALNTTLTMGSLWVACSLSMPQMLGQDLTLTTGLEILAQWTLTAFVLQRLLRAVQTKKGKLLTHLLALELNPSSESGLLAIVLTYIGFTAAFLVPLNIALWLVRIGIRPLSLMAGLLWTSLPYLAKWLYSVLLAGSSTVNGIEAYKQ